MASAPQVQGFSPHACLTEALQAAQLALDLERSGEGQTGIPPRAHGHSQVHTLHGLPAHCPVLAPQVAQFAAELERYGEAIDIYEGVARASVENNLLKYSAKGYLLNAGICQLCSALPTCAEKTSWRSQCPSLAYNPDCSAQAESSNTEVIKNGSGYVWRMHSRCSVIILGGCMHPFARYVQWNMLRLLMLQLFPLALHSCITSFKGRGASLTAALTQRAMRWRSARRWSGMRTST